MFTSQRPPRDPLTLAGALCGPYTGMSNMRLCLQVFDATMNKWTVLPEAFLQPMVTNDTAGIYRADNHAWLFGWSNGTLFQVRWVHHGISIFMAVSNAHNEMMAAL